MGKDVVKEAITDYKERVEAMKEQIKYAENYGVNATIEKYLLIVYAEFVEVLKKIEREM